MENRQQSYDSLPTQIAATLHTMLPKQEGNA